MILQITPQELRQSQQSYGLLDASVSYTRDSDGLKLTLFGKNITDEEYHDFALDNALTRLTWGGTIDIWS